MNGAARRERWLGDGALNPNRNDEVTGRTGAHVLEAMQDGRRGENDIASMHNSTLAITINLQLTIADQQQFGVGVAMRRVGHLAGWQHCLVYLDELACG